jgi:hypothetical protein
MEDSQGFSPDYCALFPLLGGDSTHSLYSVEELLRFLRDWPRLLIINFI